MNLPHSAPVDRSAPRGDAHGPSEPLPFFPQGQTLGPPLLRPAAGPLVGAAYMAAPTRFDEGTAKIGSLFGRP